MNRSAVVVGLVVVLAVIAGGVLVGGFSPGEMLDGPSAGADEPAVTTTPGATATPGASTSGTTASTTTGGTDSTATTAPEDGAGYDFTIEHVAECGTTCRNVTARLANEGSDPRENVRATTRVYADGDLLWQGNETVGRLEAGETYTSTKRVELGLAGAMAIQDNDGYVTIVTVVQSADGTERFEDRRKVG